MHCTQRSSKKEKRSSPLLAAEVFIDTTPASSRFGSPPAQLTAILKEFVLFLDHFSSAELGKPFAFSMNSIFSYYRHWHLVFCLSFLVSRFRLSTEAQAATPIRR